MIINCYSQLLWVYVTVLTICFFFNSKNSFVHHLYYQVIIIIINFTFRRWQNEKKECEGEGSCVHWRCPIKRGCAWRGAVNQVTDHLTEGHSVAVLGGAGITVEIAGFRAKVNLHLCFLIPRVQENKILRKYNVLL